MTQYKLTYFNGRGSAEIIRQLFVIAEKNYEDIRLGGEEWPKHRAGMPFGQMPVLDVNGKRLGQSNAIARYLAKQFDAWEEAVVDSIVDQYKEFSTEIRPFLRVYLGFEKGDLDAITKEVFLPNREKFFTYMKRFLTSNKSGYLVGNKLTWADLYLAEMAEFEKKVPELYEGFPEVKAHSEKIRSIPTLKKWIETRPETKF
ncbi:glutathione S-transferase protein [Cooperia oncophora]